MSKPSPEKQKRYQAMRDRLDRQCRFCLSANTQFDYMIDRYTCGVCNGKFSKLTGFITYE